MGAAFTNSVGYGDNNLRPGNAGFRARRRTEILSDSPGATSSLAALANLRSSATVRNTEGARTSLANICEFPSQRLVRLWDFSNPRFTFTLVLEDTNDQGRKPH